MPPLGDAQQADQQVQFAGGNEGRAGGQQVDRRRGRGQQWQQVDERVAAFRIKAEAAQLCESIGHEIGVTQLAYRGQQRLLATTELAAEGTVADPRGKQGGTGGHGS